ncbi:hypothetical protein [uncultured Paraglaciecola sp.]|uniref:hypothetical protein n=1 Tax=uncultured Paraglaciecola sp. TaxID=1765024 RepID=UPI0030DD8362|tara:strand:+ start:65166 stop:65852 length:687 start_codon:yes stop_codon:yes gene_type:complete
MTTKQTNGVRLVSNIKSAIGANLVPGLCLQLFAVTIGLSYFYWPASQHTFQFFADLKAQYGAWYAVISTALFGGLLPFLYLFISGKIRFLPFYQLLFYVLVWAVLGGIINGFYAFQVVLFGDGNDWLTIVKKTAFDQFVFSAFLTGPLIALVFLWKDQQFNWQKTKIHFADLIKVQIPTTVVTTWIIWIPAVSVIYMMPSNLQIPLFNLVLCFFVLILAILNVDDNAN